MCRVECQWDHQLQTTAWQYIAASITRDRLYLQNPRFLITILILDFTPVYQNQFSTHKLEPCWQCRWRCTGVIMVAMMIRMRAWAFQRMAIMSETQSSSSSNVSNTTRDVTKLLHSGKLYTILSSFNLLNYIVGYMFISTFLIVANLKGRNPKATLLLLNTVSTHPPSLHLQKFRSVS
jgi:hypothetical protein